MPAVSSMIYNRTSQDVKNAALIRKNVLKQFQTPTAEQLAILEKGFATRNTLNRIESKEKELMQSLQSKGYWNNTINNKTDWVKPNVFSQEDLVRVVTNLAILVDSFFVYDSTPNIPDPVMHYETLNAVEKTLFDIDEIITSMVSEYKMCGNYECGG